PGIAGAPGAPGRRRWWRRGVRSDGERRCSRGGPYAVRRRYAGTGSAHTGVCGLCSGLSRSLLLEAGLAGLQDGVDEPVVLGLGGREDLVALDVLVDLLRGAVGVVREGLLEPGPHPQHLVGLDLDVRGLAVVPAGEGRLVDEDAGVRECV